jgi:hypothetical protein
MTASRVEPTGGVERGEIDRSAIGWGRAVLSGVALVLVGFLVCAYLPDVILKRANMGRSERANLATAVSLVSVAVMAWILRRLQRKGVI